LPRRHGPHDHPKIYEDTAAPQWPFLAIIVCALILLTVHNCNAGELSAKEVEGMRAMNLWYSYLVE